MLPQYKMRFARNTPVSQVVPKRSVVRDLLTVMSGTAGAQVVGLLVLPFLARAFAPEAFGVFQLYLSLLIFCTVGIALRIELTLVSAAQDEVQNTIASLFGLVLMVSLTVSVALLVFEAFGPGLDFPAWLFGLGLVGNGFIQIATYKLIRDQDFNRLAALKVGQVGIYAVVALAIAVISPTIWGIIIADVAGRLAAAAFAIRILRRDENAEAPLVAIRNLIPFVRRNWELAIVSLPGALANSGGAMLTPFMIFHVFGAAAAGQYSLVDRAMGVPVAMVVGAGSQVFLGRITEQIRNGNHAAVLAVFLRIIIVSTAIMGVGILIARAFIPQVFDLAFGPGWEAAMIIASIMIFGYGAAVVTGIVNQTLIALRAFRWQSAWDFCWLGGMVATWITVLSLQLDLYAALQLHAAVIAALGLLFVLMCMVKLREAATAADAAEM